MKKYILGLAFSIFLIAIINPAFGLSISVSGGDGGQVTSNSVDYSLDPTSSMTSHTVISRGQSLTTMQAAGSGAISATSGEVSAIVAPIFPVPFERQLALVYRRRTDRFREESGDEVLNPSTRRHGSSAAGVRGVSGVGASFRRPV